MMRDRLTILRERIAVAARAAGRIPEQIELLPVTKGHSSDVVREAISLGLTRFGESYATEAMSKIEELAQTSAEWVYLGPIQSNKTRILAENFSWVLGLATEKAARRLAEQRPPGLPPLQVCVQVNADGDPAKSGIAPDELDSFLDVLDEFPSLVVRGLMTIPRRGGGSASAFKVMAELFVKNNVVGRGWDVLSMGMSADFEAAIAHGSTQVRLGTALFGERSGLGRF